MKLCPVTELNPNSYINPKNVEFFEAYNSRYGFFKQTNAILTSLIPLKEHEICLDLGCGTGIGIVNLLKKTSGRVNVIGIDISPFMLDVAKQRHVRSQRIHLIEDRAEDITLHMDMNSIDVVVCNSAIWQMDIEVVFCQVAKVLRSSGVFIFNLVEECLPEMRKLGTKGLFFQKLFPRIRTKFNIIPSLPWNDYNQFYLPEIQRQLRDAGLKIVGMKTHKLYRPPDELLCFLCMPRQSSRLFPDLPQDVRVEILKQGIEAMKEDILETPFEYVTYLVVQKVSDV